MWGEVDFAGFERGSKVFRKRPKGYICHIVLKKVRVYFNLILFILSSLEYVTVEKKNNIIDVRCVIQSIF